MAVKFECFQSGCEFTVGADSEDEVVHLVREHARRRHDLALDRESIADETERA